MDRLLILAIFAFFFIEAVLATPTLMEDEEDEMSDPTRYYR